MQLVGLVSVGEVYLLVQESEEIVHLGIALLVAEGEGEGEGAGAAEVVVGVVGVEIWTLKVHHECI